MRIALLSDTHFCPPTTQNGRWQNMMYLNQTYQLGEQLVCKLRALAPDAVLHAGDFTNDGTAASFDCGAALLDTVGCPWYLVRGNHDVSDEIATRMRERFGALNYSVQLGALRLLCLDAGQRIQSAYPGYYRRTAEMEAFLSQALSCAHAGPTALLMHYPIVLDLCPDFPARIEGADQPQALLAQVQGHVQTLLFGHWHTNGTVQLPNLTAVHIGSTCEAPYGFYLWDTQANSLRQYVLPGPIPD